MSETYRFLLNYIEDHFSEVDSELLQAFTKKAQRELASRETIHACVAVNNWKMLSPTNKATYKFTWTDTGVKCILVIESDEETVTFVGVAHYIDYIDKTKKAAKRKASEQAVAFLSTLD